MRYVELRFIVKVVVSTDISFQNFKAFYDVSYLTLHIPIKND